MWYLGSVALAELVADCLMKVPAAAAVAAVAVVAAMATDQSSLMWRRKMQKMLLASLP